MVLRQRFDYQELLLQAGMQPVYQGKFAQNTHGFAKSYFWVLANIPKLLKANHKSSQGF